ncbi:MAG: family 16 glycosylhydrolase [Bacteroidetes bacterium]|nr:family 16 glycosylhydrolase [Bacteroidota bacterium]
MHKVLAVLTLFLISNSAIAAKPYKGAEYRTKAAYLYGRFEVRMKSTPNEGVLSTFFTYFDGTPDNPWASGKWNEIDIEIIGRYRNDVQLNTITPNQISHVSHIWTDFDPAQDYHTYSIEWTPDYVSWFIDGVLVRKQTGEHISTLVYPQKIMMNTWNPEYKDWVGTFEPKSLPAFTYYDWVSYSSYTPGTGTTGEGNNFTPEWTDSLTAFDADRWEKATHTFIGNNCDFVTANAVFDNGKLVLCLTDAVNTGYKDVLPPSLTGAVLTDSTLSIRYSEPVSAEKALVPGNYQIPGLTVKEIKKTKDPAVFNLQVSKPDVAKSYKLYAIGQTDLFSAPNTMATSQLTVTQIPKPTFPLYINAGGAKAAYQYKADKTFAFNTDFGGSDGKLLTFSGAVKGTELDSVYLYDRDNLAMYQVRVPPGKYRAVLMFAEKYYTSSGKRIMDITVEGSALQKKGIDVYSKVADWTAYDVSFGPVEVTDGILDIHFSSVVGYPILSGIRVDYFGPATHVETGSTAIPDKLELIGNYPNPFNGTTTFRFLSSRREPAAIKIFDTLGRQIYEGFAGNTSADEQTFQWSARTTAGQGIASGTYFCRITSGEKSLVVPVVYIK